MAETEVELTIDSLAKSGEGVARHSGRAVFVEGALPEETVVALVDFEQKLLKARLRSIAVPSIARRTPICSLATSCGGCQWMHLDYASQIKAKQDIVWSALAHVGEIEPDDVERAPVVRSPSEYGYRRRATFHNVNGLLGFHARASHSLIAVKSCLALTAPLADLPMWLSEQLTSLKKDWVEAQLLECDGHVALSLQLKGGVKDKHRAVAESMVRSRRIDGVLLISDNVSAAPESIGNVVLREDGVFLRPDAFAQGNAAVNRALVSAALDALRVTAVDTVLELYAGNGNFTVPCAQRAKSVVAVESSRVATSLAQQALRSHDIGNVRLIEADADKSMIALTTAQSRFDCLLLDPPRAGAPLVAQWAAALLVRRLVYVACDPVSLARDAKRLGEKGYRLKSIQLFDLFPQTPHIETLATFEREG